ncbi:MAG: T9SS type A sorting domain-containing protein, partial [Chitinophagales bacterium]|nr:T9SS type A sorting domain-containing protein [Chitinophagales bacterium]
VTSGATLTIEAGTLIKGDKPTKGALIITRGSKIDAQGTEDAPIVFTSNGPVGFRTYGDWGGIILLGKSSINQAGGEAIIEGGVDDGQGNGSYGGGLTPDVNDNSGTMKYVRIEFPGIAFAPNNEINGLTCGGVGAGTTIEHIQVSYSGDDSYEFFGGTVNAKYLVAFRGLDDDFDTDNGFSGKLQFLYGLRDPNVADISGSNGFESDNDATGSSNLPQTHAIFSNVTIAGPKVTSSTTINANFKRGAHLRRNTAQDIYNSIIMGYPTGVMVDGAAVEGNATNNILQIRNTIIAGNVNSFEVASGSTFDIATWFNDPANANSVLAANTDVMLTDPFNLTAPNPVPMGGSPALTGADFTNPNLLDPFLTAVTYKGAFGTENWLNNWTEFNPQNSGYTGIETPKVISSINIYPNPMKTTSVLAFSLAESNQVNISITDLSGRMVSEVLNDFLSAGNHEITLNIPKRVSGMYFVLIHSENNNQVIKLSVE